MQALRDYLKLTRCKQVDLARRAGINPGLLYYYLNGQRTPGGKALKRLSKATGMSMERLMEGIE